MADDDDDDDDDDEDDDEDGDDVLVMTMLMSMMVTAMMIMVSLQSRQTSPMSTPPSPISSMQPNQGRTNTRQDENQLSGNDDDAAACG